MPCSLRRSPAGLCSVKRVTETHPQLQRNPALRATKRTNCLWVHVKHQGVCMWTLQYVCARVVVRRHVHLHVCGEQACGCTGMGCVCMV